MSTYSEAELNLIRSLDAQYAINVSVLPVDMFTKVLPVEVVRKGITDWRFRAVSRALKAMLDITHLRLTPEFDALVSPEDPLCIKMRGSNEES